MIRRILGIALVAAAFAAAAYVVATPGSASAWATDTATQSAGAQAGQADNNWIARSNEFANMLIAIEKMHSPESASSEGLSEYDEKISAATHEDDVAQTSETRAVLAKFQEQLPKEQDKYIRQDLEIMIHSTQLNLKQHDFAENHQIPYINASGAVFQGLRVLLDDQVAAERRRSCGFESTPGLSLATRLSPINCESSPNCSWPSPT